MGLSLDGLVSGLDTTALIKSLMDVQAIPRNLLSAKATDKNGIIAQLQKLNASVQSLATAAKDAASPEGLTRLSATASSPGVSVDADRTATPISTDIVVDRRASTHTVVTGAFSTWSQDPATFVVENADGERIEVTAASPSPRDIAAALGDAGIRAGVVSAGTDTDGSPTYRLTLTATESGAAGAFRVYAGDLAAVAAGTADDLSATPGAAVVTTGADAQLRLWAGTNAEQIVTSPTDTFEDLFDGVDLTVSETSALPVHITVAADAAATTDAAGAFVASVAGILTRIANGSKATIADAAGEATTLGVFTGDSTVRSLRIALTDAIQHPVDGVSPSSIGVSVDRYGELSFDTEKFSAAMEDDPDATTAVFTALAARVQETAETYSDKYDGLLTSRITGQQDEVKALDTQVAAWDVRLAQRKATLERQYAHLETMLSQLQSQSDYLQTQLAGMNGTKDN